MVSKSKRARTKENVVASVENVAVSVGELGGTVADQRAFRIPPVPMASVFGSPDEFVPFSDAAAEIGIRERTLRKYCLQGRIGVREGRHYRITRSSLEAFKLQPREVGNPTFHTDQNPSSKRRKSGRQKPVAAR